MDCRCSRRAARPTRAGSVPTPPPAYERHGPETPGSLAGASCEPLRSADPESNPNLRVGHGLTSAQAEGDSQPSPAGWARWTFSDQLSTYSGSRYANPCVVIRMLSKYVSSMTARRACTFPRAAKERWAAFPWGLWGVEPGWNVNEPSSMTPSRAP